MAYRLVGCAEAPIARILIRSARRFGFAASDRYGTLKFAALSALGEDTAHIASAELPTVPGVRIFHLSSGRRFVAETQRVGRPRHFVVYRSGPDGVTEILGVAHDRMLMLRAVRQSQRDADR